MQNCVTELVNRVNGATHKENLNAAFSNDPVMFSQDFIATIQRLYKSTTINASSFVDLATLVSSITFNNYANKVSKDQELQFDALFTAYFTALGTKFSIPPRSLKDRILSLVKLKIQINDSGLSFCSSARVNFKTVDDTKRTPVNNSFDLISQYNANRTLNNGIPTTVNLTTQTTQITLDGPIVSTLVTSLIQYDQLNQELALSLNKEIRPFIRSVPVTSASTGPLRLNDSVDDDELY